MFWNFTLCLMYQEDAEPFGPLSPLKKKSPQLLTPTGNTGNVPPDSIQSYTPEDIVEALAVGEYSLGGDLEAERTHWNLLLIGEKILCLWEWLIKKLKD